MAETYSQAILGASADNASQPLNNKIGDSACQTKGSEQGYMQLGTRFLVKFPDGQQRYCVYDAERSIPGSLRIVRRVS